MKNAWMLRPSPCKINRIDEFRQGNFVAIGWGSLGNLAQLSHAKIKQLLADKPYSLSGHALGTNCNTIDIFVNQMQIGDFLLVPDNEDIYFAEIIGDYTWNPACATADYPHQRMVQWLEYTTRTTLSNELRASLKAWSTSVNLSKHFNEIAARAAGKPYVPAAQKSNTIALSYPLRKDFSVNFDIPADITKDEARRLAQYLETLYFAE